MAAPGGIELERGWSARELERELGGALDREATDAHVARVVSPDAARSPGDLVVVTRPGLSELAAAGPGLLLCPPDVAGRLPAGRRWVHSHVMWVVARLIGAAPGAHGATPLRSAHAIVEPGATIDASSEVRAGAIVLASASMGPECLIGEGAILYGGVQLGARVVIGPGAVIGRPGFGFAHGPDGEVLRIPQRGGVLVEDDVEVGALATVDAGTLGPTILRRGVKLDAHVHVAHNAEIGEGTFVAAQSGFAGSVRVGAGVLVGGQVGVADHVVVGTRARLAAQSGVIGDVPAGAVVAGYPAVPRGQWLRAWASLLGRRPRSRRPAAGRGGKKGLP